MESVTHDRGGKANQEIQKQSKNLKKILKKQEAMIVPRPESQMEMIGLTKWKD